MNKTSIIISGAILVILLIGLAGFMWQRMAGDTNQHGATEHESSNLTPTSSNSPASPESETTASEKVEQTVELFHVAIGDEVGETFGCGDSLEGVKKKLTTATPLTDSIKALLALEDQYYGESGLYNALWQSDLTLQSATISNGVAKIALTGSLKLGGECDSPRVKEQLTATATQFSTVKSAEITLNGKPLDEALSTK